MPRDIRSRIAAFEKPASSSAPAPAARPKPAVAKKPPVIAATSGTLQLAGTTHPLSRTAPTPPIIRPKPSLSPANSTDPSPATTDRSKPVGTDIGGVGAVGLPGVAALRPPLGIPARLTTSPTAESREPLVPRSFDSTSPSPSSSPALARSLQAAPPIISERTTSPGSMDPPAKSAGEASASKPAPPSIPPRLPSRKATAETNSSSTSSPVIQGRKGSTSVPAESRETPKPILPPRKAGSGSSSTSANGRNDPFTSDLDPFANDGDLFADSAKPSRNQAAFDDNFAPPQQSRTLAPARAPVSTSVSKTPTRAPSHGVDRPYTASATTQSPLRSNTLQSDRQSAHRTTVSGYASFSDFPSQFQDMTSKFLDYKPSTRKGYAPPPEANKPTPAPVSGSSLSTFGTRAPLFKTDINGSQAASKTGMSSPYLVRKYTEVWDGLIDAVEPDVPPGREPRLHGRLENVLVREMWINSNLDEKALRRIW